MLRKIRELFNREEKNVQGKIIPSEVNDLNSIYYVDPEKYGCKPGGITWRYLDAVYNMAEKYEKDHK